jgi:ankyrin repeat protein
MGAQYRLHRHDSPATFDSLANEVHPRFHLDADRAESGEHCAAISSWSSCSAISSASAPKASASWLRPASKAGRVRPEPSPSQGNGAHPVRARRHARHGLHQNLLLLVVSDRDLIEAGSEIASTTRKGSSPAHCAASAASRPQVASKTKKQISSSGMWIDRSKRTRVRSRVSFLGGRAGRSPAWPRARYVSTR